MGKVYLEKISALRKYENKKIITILGYIAMKYGLTQNNKIMYRRLYTDVIKPWFQNNCKHQISYKQYNRLRKNYSGKVPKYAADFLYELYQIMISFNQCAILGESENNVTYSNYTMLNEKWRIDEAITRLNEENSPYTPRTLMEFQSFISSLAELDNNTSNNSGEKIYNNIW